MPLERAEGSTMRPAAAACGCLRMERGVPAAWEVAAADDLRAAALLARDPTTCATSIATAGAAELPAEALFVAGLAAAAVAAAAAAPPAAFPARPCDCGDFCALLGRDRCCGPAAAPPPASFAAVAAAAACCDAGGADGASPSTTALCCRTESSITCSRSLSL